MAGNDKVRVRFAPSPTGQLHIGNVRTALFNWLFARQKGGTFILRIEDTDLERSEARYETQLMEDLKWLGIDWDEGPDLGGPFPPYRQSDKMEVYRRYAERLIQEGKAYHCFCPAEELEREREHALKEQRQPIYSGKCRNLDPAEAERRRAAGEAAAIRLKIPEHPIRFHDIVRGNVEFSNEVVGDPIIIRSSGMPIYNYVVVIDDADMKITHVVRGDDHISNTPKQVAVYEALGLPVPEFAHLSTILGPDGGRLSKRHGATSVANFREMGILPEALMNYLALLGWAPSGGDREIFPKDELIREFSLERVTPSPAVFDTEKLHWLNRHYIKLGPLERIHQLGSEFLQRAGLLPASPNRNVSGWTGSLMDLLSPYVDKLDQLPERAKIIFSGDAKAALAAPENAEVFASDKARAVAQAFAKKAAGESLTAERFKAIMDEIKAETGAKGKDLFHPVRIMLIGSHSGPDFNKLIPLIEEGSRLELPVHVKSVRERAEEFVAALRQHTGA
ncbi:MAG TPA: glutamate--tRNA ligase, partial [Candidatus Sulfotelmatobacter sp.]|nr:glutamate--tRNA ligase [Candidatus Sulfotelmatobacter sp.]